MGSFLPTSRRHKHQHRRPRQKGTCPPTHAEVLHSPPSDEPFPSSTAGVVLVAGVQGKAPSYLCKTDAVSKSKRSPISERPLL